MLQVGQKLWYVDQHSYRPVAERGREVVVTKIGRKWAELGNERLRVNAETLWADGGQYSSPGRCYTSEDAYRYELAKESLWRDFASRVSRSSPPDGVTADTIRQIAEMLRIPLNH